MTARQSTEEHPSQPRLSTGISGLDAILGGGLPIRRTTLVAGQIGTGKTTLSNQIAFHHARKGGTVLVATLLNESHDLLLQNLSTFRFFQEDLVGGSIRYINVLTALIEEGLEATTTMLWQEVRRTGANLLVVDGTSIIQDLTPSAFDLRQFAQQLESHCAMLGCTALLLTSYLDDALRLLGGNVNGAILLRHDMIGRRRLRMLDILKMRGISYSTGEHEFTITNEGVEVYPRLESLAGRQRFIPASPDRLSIGAPKIDLMLGGGMMEHSATVVAGAPGTGKTILGLSFIEAGASRGERGLIVGFHEPEAELAATARGVGRDLQRFLDDGTVKVSWNAPLELSSDAWAWKVLKAVEEHGSSRVFIDALTDLQRIISLPERIPAFVTALVNELRNRQTTILMAVEMDEYASSQLKLPVPAASATMDAGLLLRNVEVNGRLRRMISVLKVRQSAFEPVIREMQITDHGIDVTQSFQADSGILTGNAELLPGESHV